MKSRFYLTTPLYYVNDEPHLGHAYTTVLADTLTRFHRLFDDDVHFLTGLDEHGQKVAQAAEKLGRTPQEHCDITAQRFLDAWEKLGIEYDDFIRTTQPRHQKVVAEVLQKLYDKGEIYQGEYEGWYSVHEERYFTEKDLVDGKDPIGGREVVKMKEKNYFFEMSKYQQWLIDWYEAHPDAVLPAFRLNEVLGFLRQPLGDLNISRPKARLSWGIPIPWDAEYVTYVWFDALLNYYSATVTPPPNRPAPQWPAQYHLIGKDILTTHAVYWPIMLHAAGLEPPEHILAHGWWMGVDMEKMSKSRGNVIKPIDMADIYGPDSFRYFLMRNMVVGQDASFGEAELVKRLNSDLANDLGNLLNRVTKLVEKNFDGVMPEMNIDEEDSLFELAGKTAYDVHNAVEQVAIHVAIEETLQFVRAINREFTEAEPWALAKTDREAAGTVLARAAEGIRIASILLSPVMPNKTAEVLARLGVTKREAFSWKEVAWGKTLEGNAITHGEAIFPRHEMPVEEETQEKLKQDKKQPEGRKIVADEQGLISIDDFKQVDLQTAKVLEAEPVEGTDKLMQLKIEVGDETRQLVAGVKEHYSAEQLVGKTIIIVANLQPAKIRGVESQGMLLAVRDGDGMSLLTPDSDTSTGQRIS